MKVQLDEEEADLRDEEIPWLKGLLFLLPDVCGVCFVLFVFQYPSFLSSLLPSQQQRLSTSFDPP